MKKILVASEESSLRRLVAACLRKRNFRIAHLDNPRESRLVAEREAPDLVILDNGFGNHNGQAVFREFHEHGTRDAYKLLIIFDQSESNRDVVVVEGADELLVRPFSPPRLRQCIDQLLTD